MQVGELSSVASSYNDHLEILCLKATREGEHLRDLILFKHA